jgi:hypothetical protein
VNPPAREPSKRDTFRCVEPRGRFEKTYRAVRDEVFERYAVPDRPRSNAARDRPDVTKVSSDEIVARVAFGRIAAGDVSSCMFLEAFGRARSE